MDNEDYLVSVRENFLHLQDEAFEAAERYSDTNSVEICLATKTVPPDVINSLVPYGLRHIGENRMQELEDKYESYDSNLSVDFIGTLQSNKVRSLVGRVRMIQSLSTVSALNEVQRICGNRSLTQDVLIEINSAREENKSGVMPDAFGEFVAQTSEMKNLRLCGIMTVGAFSGDEKQYSECFFRARELFEKYKSLFSQSIISMGMSDNYITAIKCGANLIRPGRAVFGERNYGKRP